MSKKKILIISSNRLGDSILSSGLNKFFKNEIGKKPQISICIHRMDIM